MHSGHILLFSIEVHGIGGNKFYGSSTVPLKMTPSKSQKVYFGRKSRIHILGAWQYFHQQSKNWSLFVEVNHLFCLWTGKHPNSSKCTFHETPTTNSKKVLFYQVYHCFNKTLPWKNFWPRIAGYCHILGFWDPSLSFIFALLLAGQKPQYTDWIHQPLMRLRKMFPYVYSWPWKVKIQNWRVHLL